MFHFLNTRQILMSFWSCLQLDPELCTVTTESLRCKANLSFMSVFDQQTAGIVLKQRERKVMFTSVLVWREKKELFMVSPQVWQ